MQKEPAIWTSCSRAAGHPVTRAWLTDLAARVRPQTLVAYAHDIEDYLAACEPVTVEDLIEADTSVIDRYSVALAARPPRPGHHHRHKRARSGDRLSPATITRRLAALHTFYAWLQSAGLRRSPYNPVVAPVRTHRPLPAEPWLPGDQEFERLIHHVLTSPTLSQRSTAIVLVLYDGALRLGEVSMLRLSHLRPETREVVIPHLETKGRTPGSIFLSEVTWARVQTYIHGDRAYLAARAGLARGEGPLFLAESNARLGQSVGRAAVYQLFVQLRVTLNLPELRPHTLRHLCLTHLSTTLDLLDLAAYARHRSSSTTARYVHRSGPRLARLVSEAHRRHWTQLEASAPREDGDAERYH
jgi:integrase/recombinase XerC